jgi:serine/threonine-protein kinase
MSRDDEMQALTLPLFALQRRTFSFVFTVIPKYDDRQSTRFHALSEFTYPFWPEQQLKHCPTCQHLFADPVQVCPTDGAALRLVRELEPGMIVRNKYLVLEWLGAGGMAVVYRAKHLLLNEMRAVKVVSAKFAADDDFLKRFRHEAAVARRLRHENAVWVEDLDELEDGRPFIAMELLQGDDLRKVIKEQGPLAVDRSLLIGAQVASALSAAHKLGIVHRDIKPDNIVITHNDEGKEVAKVLDFGIAKAKESSLQGGYTATKTGVIIGTPEYMSPEQAESLLGDRLDGRSDVYSLGIVLYEMLTGQLPFKSDTPLGMCMHHLQTIPRPPHEVRPDLHIPESVSMLLMKALEKKREQRFQSAQEMLAALHNPEEWAAKNKAPELMPTQVASNVSTAAAAAPATIAIPPPTPVAPPKPQSVAATVEPARTQEVKPPSPAVVEKPKPVFIPATPTDQGRIWRVLIVALVVVVCIVAGYGLVKATQRRNEALRNHNMILRNLVLEKIKSSAMVGKNIDVTIDSDVATLTGSVPLPSDKDAAANLARSVDGIATVTNNIQVVGLPAQKPPSSGAGSQPPTDSSNGNQAQAQPAAQPSQGSLRNNLANTAQQRSSRSNAANTARVNELIRQAGAELDNGQYTAAINDFQKAAQLDPGNTAARNGITRARSARAAEQRILK